jgi:hypothetical protein
MTRFAGDEMELGALMEEAAGRAETLALVDGFQKERERMKELARLRGDKLVGPAVIAHGWDGTEPVEAFGGLR